MTLKDVSKQAYPWKISIVPKRDIHGEWKGWLWTARRPGERHIIYAHSGRELLNILSNLRNSEEQYDEMADLRKAALDYRGMP